MATLWNPGHSPWRQQPRPEGGDIPPTHWLLDHHAAHGRRPWRNGGVEEAEAHGPIRQRVVTRWTDGAEGGIKRAGYHAINGPDDRTHGIACGLPGPGRAHRIRIERRRPIVTGLLDRLHIGARMDHADRLMGSGGRVEGGQLTPHADGAQMIADGLQAMGLLRVTRSGVVAKEAWVEAKPDAPLHLPLGVRPQARGLTPLLAAVVHAFCSLPTARWYFSRREAVSSNLFLLSAFCPLPSGLVTRCRRRVRGSLRKDPGPS